MSAVRYGWLLGLLAGSSLGWVQEPPAQAPLVDPDLKVYRPVAGVSGSLSSVGSDTLAPLMMAWAERFKRFYPSVEFTLEGKGSNLGPPALISGTSQLSPMSRALKAAEIEEFEKRFGYKPRGIRAAVDSICIFVHKDNPIASLSLEQLDAVFSKTRRRGGKEVRTWGDLGLGGDWATRPVRTFGRNSDSGTHLFFKGHALQGGDFKEGIQEKEGSTAVVKEVSQDPGAIGYCGHGYAIPGVRALSLWETRADQAVEPTAQHAYAGEYPLSRILFVYFNLPPGRSQDLAVREFIRMVCSKEGQEVVSQQGFFPMPASVAKEELAKAD